MKLHLPKVLFAAVVAALTCVQQAEAATYYLNAAAGDNVNLSASIKTESGGSTGVDWKKFCSSQTGFDGPHQLVIDQARAENNKVKIDFAPFCVSGLNVVAGATNNHIVRYDEEKNIVIGNAADGAGAQSSSFAEDFTIEHEGTGVIELVGEQTWTIENDKTLNVLGSLTNTGTTTINGSAISISGTLTNNGTLSFGCSVNTGALNIAANSAVTFSDDLTVGTTIVNDGSISLEGDAKVVLESFAAFDNTGWGDKVDYSIESNGVQDVDIIYTIEKGSATSKLSSVWCQGSEYTLDNGCAAVAIDVYVVVSDEVTVGGDSATEGTADVAGFAVGENGTLKIAGASSALSSSKILGSTTGTGTMVLSTAADVVAGQSLTFEGTLKLSSGGTLNFGKVKGAQADMSNLSSLIFDGGTLNYNAAGSEIKNVTVTTNGGTMNVQDFINLNENPERIEFTGDTTLNGNLTYHTTYKSLLTVEHLTGSGNFTISTGDNADGGANVVISSMTGYAGTLILNGQVANGASRNPVAVTATLDSGYTLNASQVQIGNVAGSLSLTGSGTYNLGASKTMTTGVSLADTWEGSVKVTGTVNGEGDAATLSRYDINDLNGLEALDTTDKGKVVLSGVKGFFTAAETPGEGDTFSADIELENYELNGTSHAALTIDDGYSVDDSAVAGDQDRHSIINGSISGSGDLEFAKSSGDAKYLMQGDVSGWNGTLKATKSTLYLVAGGEATTWKAAIIDKQGASNAGAINLSVDNTGKTTTFSKEVSVSSLTVTDGSTAKFTAKDEETGASKLSVSGNITLGKGAALDVTGSITLDATKIKLAEGITFDSAEAVTLLTVTDGSLTVNNVGSWTGSTYSIGGKEYTTSLNATDSLLQLIFNTQETGSLMVDSASLAGSVLTLNIDANLTDVSSVDLMLSEAALADIKGMSGLVSLSLVATNGTFTTVETDGATLINNVTFYNGAYAGEGAGMYQIAYIPEPTTATLSLLALAGLAARRRRK